jgi:hypothetical protein
MPIGYTSSLGSLLAGWALPVVVLFGLACALTAVLTRSQATRRVAARLRSRLTHLADLGGRR